MSSSSSSIYRRLHGVFTKSVKPQTIKPKVPKPIINEAITKPESSNKKKFKDLVRKFKHSSNNVNFRHNYSKYEAFVRRLTVSQQFSAVEDVIEHHKKYPEMKNEGYVVRLISLYGKANMFEHAQKLFDEMPELKCERTVLSFNAMLAACVNSKKFDKISEIFTELPKKLGIEPNVVSYNTTVKAFCQMGSFDSALLVIDEMGKNGIDPNVVTFNTILDAFYKNKRLSEAEKIWDMMEKKNVIPNVWSYNSKLRGFVDNNQVLEAGELFEEMKKREVKPDTHSHNAMITACANDGNLELAKSWYGKLEENGCVPDHVTFGLLIPLACDNADRDFAYELCKKSIDLKVVVYGSTVQRVVDLLVAGSMFDEAKDLVELGKSCSLRYKLTLPNEA